MRIMFRVSTSKLKSISSEMFNVENSVEYYSAKRFKEDLTTKLLS